MDKIREGTLYIDGVEFGTIMNFEIKTKRNSTINKFPIAGKGSFKLKNPKKFACQVLGIKNSYYKHLKRVRNRNKLHNKRGLICGK